MEGNVHGLILSGHFSVGTEENHLSLESAQPVIRPKFEPGRPGPRRNSFVNFAKINVAHLVAILCTTDL